MLGLILFDRNNEYHIQGSKQIIMDTFLKSEI